MIQEFEESLLFDFACDIVKGRENADNLLVNRRGPMARGNPLLTTIRQDDFVNHFGLRFSCSQGV